MPIDEITNGGIEPEKKEFTSQDFENYLKKLSPYEKKVYEDKEFLEEKDLKALEGIREELRTIFGLKKSKLYGIIGGIINYNQMRGDHKEEQELEEEGRRLRSELKEKEGILTKKEKEQIKKRLNVIDFKLIDPWHYYGDLDKHPGNPNLNP